MPQPAWEIDHCIFNEHSDKPEGDSAQRSKGASLQLLKLIRRLTLIHVAMRLATRLKPQKEDHIQRLKDMVAFTVHLMEKGWSPSRYRYYVLHILQY